MKRLSYLIVIVSFITNCIFPFPLSAQTLSGVAVMPEPGTMAELSASFIPAHLVGLTIDVQNALKFDFIIHKGDMLLTQDQKPEEYRQLVKYFLAALAIPDEDQWVNLSPYEGSRIIKDSFGMTEMGRDLLSQDYLLKQLTASLMHPDSELGKRFWERIYEQTWEKYGTTDIPVDTFNKIWITPDSAVVYEKGNSALVVESRLKVLTERDYLSLDSNALLRNEGPVPVIAETTEISSQIVREVIIPEIEREVNEGKNFANLRQIYTAMVLATWYKQALKESLLGKIYADQARVKGIDQDPKNNELIYQQYIVAFQKGVFNFIKEDFDRYAEEMIPRKYFSGGFVRNDAAMRITQTPRPEQIRPLQEAAQSQEFDEAMVSFEIAQPTLDAAMRATAPENLKSDPQLAKTVLDTLKQFRAEDLDAYQRNGFLPLRSLQDRGARIVKFESSNKELRIDMEVYDATPAGQKNPLAKVYIRKINNRFVTIDPFVIPVHHSSLSNSVKLLSWLVSSLSAEPATIQEKAEDIVNRFFWTDRVFAEAQQPREKIPDLLRQRIQMEYPDEEQQILDAISVNIIPDPTRSGFYTVKFQVDAAMKESSTLIGDLRNRLGGNPAEITNLLEGWARTNGNAKTYLLNNKILPKLASRLGSVEDLRRSIDNLSRAASFMDLDQFNTFAELVGQNDNIAQGIIALPADQISNRYRFAISIDRLSGRNSSSNIVTRILVPYAFSHPEDLTPELLDELDAQFGALSGVAFFLQYVSQNMQAAPAVREKARELIRQNESFPRHAVIKENLKPKLGMSAEEFSRAGLNPQALLEALVKDGITLPSSATATDQINAFLANSDITGSLPGIMNNHPGLTLPAKTIERINNAADLTEIEKRQIVNRLVFQLAYPEYCPPSHRALFVHNNNDGLGDELIQVHYLAQAVLDLNPLTEVTVVTKKPFLYQFPGVKVLSPEQALEQGAISGRFDVVMNMYNPLKPYDKGLEDLLKTNKIPEKAFLYIDFNKDAYGLDSYSPQEVRLAGTKLEMGLKMKADNVYATIYQMLAGFGLPMRIGQEENPESIITGVAGNPKDEQVWKIVRNVLEKTGSGDEWDNEWIEAEGRYKYPVDVLNPFGFEQKNKAGPLQNEETVINAIKTRLEQGRRVVLTPNGRDWGTKEIAEGYRARLPEDLRKKVTVAPEPGRTESDNRNWIVTFQKLGPTAEFFGTTGGLEHLLVALGKTYHRTPTTPILPDELSPGKNNPDWRHPSLIIPVSAQLSTDLAVSLDAAMTLNLPAAPQDIKEAQRQVYDFFRNNLDSFTGSSAGVAIKIETPQPVAPGELSPREVGITADQILNAIMLGNVLKVSADGRELLFLPGKSASDIPRLLTTEQASAVPLDRLGLQDGYVNVPLWGQPSNIEALLQDDFIKARNAGVIQVYERQVKRPNGEVRRVNIASFALGKGIKDIPLIQQPQAENARLPDNVGIPESLLKAALGTEMVPPNLKGLTYLYANPYQARQFLTALDTLLRGNYQNGPAEQRSRFKEVQSRLPKVLAAYQKSGLIARQTIPKAELKNGDLVVVDDGTGSGEGIAIFTGIDRDTGFVQLFFGTGSEGTRVQDRFDVYRRADQAMTAADLNPTVERYTDNNGKSLQRVIVTVHLPDTQDPEGLVTALNQVAADHMDATEVVIRLETAAPGALQAISTIRISVDPRKENRWAELLERLRENRAAAEDFLKAPPSELNLTETTGGIDLNAAQLDMQIRRDGNGVPLPVAQQDLENLRIDGLVPRILDIRPITNLPILSKSTNDPSSSSAWTA